MQESTGKVIMAIATAGCLLMVGALAYVVLCVEPAAHVPPYSGPPVQARPPLPVRPGDAEVYGFRHGDAEVSKAYARELRRRAAAMREER